MAKYSKVTSKQLKAIINRISDVYSKDFSEIRPDNPYFENIEADGHIYKVGIILGEVETPRLMEIKIVYKGEVNGN